MIRVRVKDMSGLSEDTLSKIESTMIYTKNFYEGGIRFAELYNSKGEVIRIFPERIEEVLFIINDKDTN